MPLMARGGKLLVNSNHKLAKSCGPPGCAFNIPSLFPACNGVIPDSLTVTFSGITVCTGCHDVATSIGDAPPQKSFFLNSIDINKSFCLAASGANTWRVDVDGDYGTLYQNGDGSAALGCAGDANAALNTLTVIVTAIGDGAGGWYYWITAYVGSRASPLSAVGFVGCLFTHFIHYATATIPCNQTLSALTSRCTDCAAFVGANNIVATTEETNEAAELSSLVWTMGTGGTAGVVKCCQCPSTGEGCCNTVKVNLSGDVDLAGEYTFVRSGNHWNGEFGSVIHCVRGRWEMIIKSENGLKSPIWTAAGDGLNDMECPPLGVPADWGDPVLNGASSVTLDSIECDETPVCAPNCDLCCDVVRFEFLDPNGEPAYVEFTKDSASGEPCSWEPTDSSFFVTDANLTCTDGQWLLFTVHDGVIEQSFLGDATSEGCVSDDLADYETIAGGKDLTHITLTGCA